MSYSGRKRYKSRRERNKQVAFNARYILLGILAVIAMLIYRHRVSIIDYLETYFY